MVHGMKRNAAGLFVVGSLNPNWKGGGIDKTCEACGDAYVAKRAQIKSRFCSLRCVGLSQRKPDDALQRPRRDRKPRSKETRPRKVRDCSASRDDLTGRRFYFWAVVGVAGLDGNNKITWRCVCDCGTERNVLGGSLRQGKSRSCGCLSHINHRTHGMSHTPTYNVWATMRARCSNPNDSGYHNYGGRGITVCGRWNDSFEAFLEDMGKVPSGLTIDRKDNNLGYFKENCRWATRTTQSRNRRNVLDYTVHGETHSLPVWSDITGIDRRKLYDRIVSKGWELERAIPLSSVVPIECRAAVAGR